MTVNISQSTCISLNGYIVWADLNYPSLNALCAVNLTFSEEGIITPQPQKSICDFTKKYFRDLFLLKFSSMFGLSASTTTCEQQSSKNNFSKGSINIYAGK